MALATRIVAPKTAKKGDVVEIKTLISHVMETGFRRDNMGRAVPRDIITKMRCTYAGEDVFAMDLFTGVAANPFIVFTTIATETGTLVFEWTDMKGEVTRAETTLTVT
jgi:sulfur-oxidizing protein SoxZ